MELGGGGPKHPAAACLSQVNEAEEERLRSEREHMRVTHACQEAEARVQMLQKSLKRVIVKSKPYFELKAQFNHILEVMHTYRVHMFCAVDHVLSHLQFPILTRRIPFCLL